MKRQPHTYFLVPSYIIPFNGLNIVKFGKLFPEQPSITITVSINSTSFVKTFSYYAKNRILRYLILMSLCRFLGILFQLMV